MDDTPDTLTYTIPQFCRTHNLSTSGYYELRKEGLTPNEIHLGRKRLISAEAAAEWRRKMERQADDRPAAA